MKPMLKSIVSLAVVGTTLFMAGCDQVNPASVCSDPHTIGEINTLLAKQIAAGDIGANALKAISPNFGLLTLTSYDKTTKKTTCSAQVHVTIPPADQTEMRTNDNAMTYLMANSALLNPVGLQNGQADVKITYSRQPSADGQTLIYTYVDNSAIEGLATFVAQFEAMVSSSRAKPTATVPRCGDRSTRRGATPSSGHCVNHCGQ